MRVEIDAEVCTGCGLCVDTCPNVFEMDNDVATVREDEVPEGEAESVRESADACPVEAIKVED
jgi:ferredoxin